MKTQDQINWKALAEPFAPEDIEWRVQQSGVKNDKPWAMVLAYVTNRAIMQRLDDVVGPGNWKNEYSAAPTDGVLCGISIRVNGEWVIKYDGAENTEIEAVKGGLSGAMKRAAVQWGIGRYLYNLDTTFVEISDIKGQHYIAVKDKTGNKFTGYWNAPALPGWALPSKEADVEAKSEPEGEPLDFTASLETLRIRMAGAGLFGDAATNFIQAACYKKKPINMADIDKINAALDKRGDRELGQMS